MHIIPLLLLLQWVVAFTYIPPLTSSPAPGSNITSKYQMTNSGKRVGVELKFTTDRPAVHLDNLHSVRYYTCIGSNINITFNSVHSAQLAFALWERVPSLAVLVSPKRSCNGDEVGTFLVEELNMEGLTLKMKTDMVERGSIVKEWSLVMHQLADGDNDDYEQNVAHNRNQWNEQLEHFKPENDQIEELAEPLKFKHKVKIKQEVSNQNQKDSTHDSIQLYKRNYWKDVKKDLKELKEHINENVNEIQQTIKENVIQLANHPQNYTSYIKDEFSWENKAARTHKGRHFDLTANFNTSTQSISQDRIIIIESMQISAYCDHCYTIGAVDTYMELSGVGPIVTSYNISIQGHIKANVDLMIVFLHEFETNPLMTILVLKFLTQTLDIFPFHIPGIGNIAPQFLVKTGVNLEGWGELGTTMGTDFEIPIDMNLQSSSIASMPSFISRAPNAVYNPHRIDDLKTGIKSWLTYQFDLILHWGIDMFPVKEIMKSSKSITDFTVAKSSPFNIELYFDNLIGFSHAIGNLTRCGPEKMSIELFHDSAVKFKIVTPWISKRWFLWRLKDIMKCWFCDECGVPVPLGLPVPSLTDGDDIIPKLSDSSTIADQVIKNISLLPAPSPHINDTSISLSLEPSLPTPSVLAVSQIIPATIIPTETAAEIGTSLIPTDTHQVVDSVESTAMVSPAIPSPIVTILTFNIPSPTLNTLPILSATTPPPTVVPAILSVLTQTNSLLSIPSPTIPASIPLVQSASTGNSLVLAP